MAAPAPNIFISYARRDAATLALRLQKDFEAHGHQVWLDKARLRGGASWTIEIEKAIDGCDVAIALLTPGSYASDICRAEQLRALRHGKHVIPLRAARDTEIPLHLETRQYLDFTGLKAYDRQLGQLFEAIRTGSHAVVPTERVRSTYVTAPPLPRNYIDRPLALTNLRNAVILDEPGPSVALVALDGMGGIGKTVLAQALARDEAVQQAFPDGIGWTTAGKDGARNLVAQMHEVRRALGDAPDPAETESECINRYRTLLAQKAAFVIVDDVWRTVDIEPFLADSPRSRLLFTTRDATIAAAVGVTKHTADLLSREQSRALLAQASGYGAAALPCESEDLIQECGRLPLALAMIGAMLRNKPSPYWTHVLKLLRQGDLKKIGAPLPFYRHSDLMRAVQVSVKALEKTARERYVALAVLLEDMPAATAVQQTLWNVDEDEALETAELFVSRSLAQRDADGRGIRLHDLQLDYVRAEYQDSEALEVIQAAVRLSSHVIASNPIEFASQLSGRLLSYRDDPPIESFRKRIVAGAPAPWLRPLRPTLHPPGTELVRTLVGHTAAVNAVALTGNGKWAVSASEDKTLKVWDLESGRALRTLEGHAASVSGVAVTADGKRLGTEH
jgi:hypothetical protein